MVQNSRTASVVIAILLRLGLLLAIVGVSLFTPISIHDFVQNTLGYIKPSGFFGFTFADWEIAYLLTATVLGGIIFGLLGKKIDYIFIIGFFILVSLEFYTAENMTLKVYLGLVGAAVLGNAVGFALKLLRQRFLPGIKI